MLLSLHSSVGCSISQLGTLPHSTVIGAIGTCPCITGCYDTCITLACAQASTSTSLALLFSSCQRSFMKYDDSLTSRRIFAMINSLPDYCQHCTPHIQVVVLLGHVFAGKLVVCVVWWSHFDTCHIGAYDLVRAIVPSKLSNGQH